MDTSNNFNKHTYQIQTFLTQQTEYNNQQRHTHHPTRFFLVVSLFIIAMSILAVYSTITASEYGLKKR
jgi:hypothetical protein